MTYKKSVQKNVNDLSEKLVSIARKIFKYKEVAYEEYKSAKELSNFLEERGFQVSRGVAELETAFIAKYGSTPPHIALLAEYDALPSLGHACGHNLIGTISAGAAVALKESGILEHHGTVSVIGSPAEESGGGKVALLKHGVFDDVDVAMMIHPASMTTGFDIAYAIDEFKVEYFGKASHAASAPERGINALDAMINAFVGIGLLRQQLPENARIHGIITNGGQASNIIPEYTKAEVGVRALKRKELDKIVEKFGSVLKGAAKSTGCRLKITKQMSLDNVKVNVPLAQTLESNFKAIGEEVVKRTYEQGVGSTDMGNVTQKVPGIHAYINVTNSEDIAAHTQEFARACNSEYAYSAMLRAAKALGMTCLDIIEDGELLKKIRAYFKEGIYQK